MNILWIVTTQWRAQATGYAGDTQARTPALDAFSARSVNYSQAVTPHPFGPFARAALLTGTPSPENGVADYFDALPVGTRTIAHELAERGYHTAFFGKWHLGERDPRVPLVGEAHARTFVPPERRGGFEFWEGFESGFVLNDPWLHGSRLPEPRQFAGYQSDVLAERAGEYLDSYSREHARPWFALVSLESPHPPYAAPSGGIIPVDPATLILSANVPRGSSVEAQARRELAGYYAHIEATDRAIGRLLDRFADATTVIVVTSVHGDMHGAHGCFRKGWPHEESVRVPLLVSGPRRLVGRSGLLDAPLSLTDLNAFTLGWAEARCPVVGRTHSVISMPSVVALPQQCDRMWRGVRTVKRKLILNADGGTWLFFDLERDPLELENLAHDPARAFEIAQLRQLMQST